mgnify:FL=1
MAQLSEAGFMMAAPEVGLPLEIGKQLAPHAPTILMIPLVVLSILFIVIGIIVVSADKSKTPGALLLTLGFLLGGGAFLVMYKTESRAGRAA